MALEEIFHRFNRRDWERETVEGTVRIAVVGVGGFARSRAIPGIEDGQYCKTTVLVSGSPERARTVADEYDVERVIDYNGFLNGDAAEAYDAVYLATPNAFHGEYASAAADREKHVICEKPLETTVDRTRDLVERCQAAGVTLMTAYRLQAEPVVRRTREIVRGELIGEVVQVHGSFSHPVLETAGPDTWRLDADLAGGGALVDLGIYPLNTTRYILDSDPDTVYATTHSSGPPFDEVDEHAAFQLRFPNGATGSFTASFDAHAHSRLQLVGTGGMVSISSPFGGVVPQQLRVESGDMCMEYTGEPIDEVREEFDYFGYCVLTDTEPEPDGREGLIDSQVIDAAYESAQTECAVTPAFRQSSDTSSR